jgi:VCBS repeat-containing protein
VNPVNDAPLAANDTYTTDEDTTLLVDTTTGVLANDFDVDGDVLTVVVVTGPAHGILSLSPDGSFSYTPDADWFGVDSFVYEVTDGELTDTATVIITVNPVNDAPVAVDDYVVTDEDTSVIIDFMGNDYDIEGDFFDWAQVTWSPPEIHGVWEFVDIEVSPGVTRTGIKYTPDANWYGSSSSMYYLIADSHGTVSAAAHIYITVNPVNDAPVAEDDSYTINEDSILEIDALGGVLSNDSDIDGNELSAALISGPSHGSLQMAHLHTPPMQIGLA